VTWLFWVVGLLYMGFTASGPLFAILPWSTGNSTWYHLPKVFYFPAIALLAVHWVLSRKSGHGLLGTYLFVYGITVMLFGVARNGLSVATWSHVQALSLPFLGLSFGAAALHRHGSFTNAVQRWTPYVGGLLLLLIGLYFFLVSRGVVVYFGVSTLIALPFAWALSRNRIGVAVLFFVAAIVTGKRVSIVGLGILFLVYLWQRRRNRPVTVLGISVALIVGLMAWGPALADASILRRLSFLWTLDEAVDLNLATAGRVGEAAALLEKMRESPLAWINGFGAGATFVWEGPSGGALTAHYSHFSPLSYVFLGGVLLMLPIYGVLFRHCVRYSLRAEEWYEWMFLYYVLASFSGAILFSDPFAWIVIGMAVHSRRHRASQKGFLASEERSTVAPIVGTPLALV
jgi:hypothetical protein